MPFSKSNKALSFSIDVAKLSNAINTLKEEQKTTEEKETSIRSTVFSVGNDPRVSSIDQVSTPDLFLVELLNDQLKRLFVRLNWKVGRFDISSGQIIGFNVYRRRIRNLLDNKLSVFDFNKLDSGLKKAGKFNTDKKGISFTKKGIIPLSLLNPKLSEEQESGKAGAINKKEKTTSLFSEIESLSLNKFEKVAYVDYTKFIEKEKQKKVFVTDANFVNLSFDDRNAGYRETFEYFVTSVTKTGEETHQSDSIKVLVIDNRGISSPSVVSRQVSEKEILLSVRFLAADKVSEVIVERKAEDEIVFRKKVTVKDISGECVNISDSDVVYSKTYSYRIFLKNLDGIFSDPAEITVFSSAHRITDKGKSNNLKIPILSTVQDQNSNFAKITIFPNDSSILYYRLDRKDLTISEKDFKSPSATTTGYGGTGWDTNQFFVDKENLSEIVFIDDTVTVGHIYRYRAIGFDLFGNSSSYVFSIVKIEKLKVLRSPIHTKVEILRQFPIKLKLSWKDDNANVDKDAVSYILQRRKQGEIVYESFPVTKNNFAIDESLSDNTIDFSTEKIQDTFTIEENITVKESNVVVSNVERRPFGLPDFLKENDVYFYRIKALLLDGRESNFTEEIRVSTLAELSNPINFKVFAENIRIRPLTVRLSWQTEKFKLRPDQWVVEKKIDDGSDTFKTIGRSYLREEFFDRDVDIGKRYVYRIKSIDTLKRESVKIEARIST